MPGSSPKTVSKAPAMRLTVPGPEGDSCPSGQPYLSSSPTKSRRKKTRRRSPQLVSRPDTGEPKQSINRHLTIYSRMDVAHCGGRPRPDARQLLIDVAHCGGRPE